MERSRQNPTPQEELRLLNRARALDEEALIRIHDLYYRPIFRYVAFRVADQATTEDITSEVFTRLLSALREKSAPQKTIRGWLYGTAANLVKEYYRHKKNHPEVELTADMSRPGGEPGRELDRKLEDEHLYAALKTLTDDQQNVLALRFGNGWSIAETADHLGKSQAAVKMLQARAVAALAKTMGQETGRLS